MAAADYLIALSRLVALLGESTATDDDRLAAVRALVEIGARETLAVRVSRSGMPGTDDDGRPIDPSATEPLRDVLRRHRVAGIFIRRGAGARELAQFAGLLARTDATLIAHALDELGIWSVALELYDADEIDARVPHAVRAAIATVAAARTAPAIARAYEDVGAALAAAPQVARGVAALAAVSESVASRLGTDLAAAHQDGLRAIVDAHFGAVVAAVADGTAPDAWRAARASAQRAVPLLLERLGEAGTEEERQGGFRAILDAGAGVDALLAGLADERWLVVRSVALVLGELREPAAIRPLARLLHAPDERVRDAAARALLRIDAPAATHALVVALRDASVAVRRVAAHAVRRAPEHRVPLRPNALADQLGRERDVGVAHDLVETLRSLGTSDAFAALVAVAGDDSAGAPNGLGVTAPARAASLRVLSGVPYARLVPALRALAKGRDRRLASAAQRVAAIVLPRVVPKAATPNTAPGATALSGAEG